MSGRGSIRDAACVLAVNAGSSSIRFALYDVTEPLLRRLRGKIERIGLSDTTLTVDDSTGACAQSRAIDASEHSSAVGRWAGQVADRLGLDSKTVLHCELAGRYHDIGKVVIPDEILQKPGPLDAAEWQAVRCHPAEGARLARVIGDKTVLFMANHGISTVGATVADAYDRLYYIELAAQVQIYAMWTGQPLKQLPAAVVEKTKRDIGGTDLYQGPTPAQRHFDALKRVLDRKEPDYAS